MRKGIKDSWKKKTWIIALILISLVTVLAIIWGNVVDNENTLSEMVQDEELKHETIKSKYIDLQILSECAAHIEHKQEIDGDVISDMFYMRTGTISTPVFSFSFGDEKAGDWLGMLSVSEKNIPVTYTVFMITDEELIALGEGAVDIYAKLLECFNCIVDGIYSNDGFSANKPLKLGKMQENIMSYWTVTLPSEMVWYETNENGNYLADFSGYVCGERIPLYCVCIGNEVVDSVLGTLKIDGVEKKVSVKCYDLGERSDWTEEDFATAYLMMDTINDVIQQITQSELFSEIIVEEETLI